MSTPVHAPAQARANASPTAQTGALSRATREHEAGEPVPESVREQASGPRALDSITDKSSRFGHDFSRIPTNAPSARGIQRKLAINKRGDVYEREADRIADQVLAVPENLAVSKTAAHVQRFTRQEPGQVDVAPASIERVLASPGMSLDPVLQRDMGRRFGHDFSRVRVHSDAVATQSAREMHANAYTVGHNIVFGAGRFTPGTHEGRRLIAHELTHVLQQSGSSSIQARQSNEERHQSPEGVAGAGEQLSSQEIMHVQRQEEQQSVFAGKQTDEADAQVSLGSLDNAYVGKAAEELVGHTHWLVLREFLRGLWAGFKSISPEQQQRIDKKFEDFGITEALKYVGGYALGIVEGIGLSIKGLVEAVITLIRLPYDIDQFLIEKVPELTVRYGPRIIQFLREGDGLSGRIKKVIQDFIDHPIKSVRQISAFLDALGNMALAQVRALGRSVAGKTLNLLEEPWYEYGLDIGKIVGQVLFEVILAVASDAIANIVKEAISIAGRISARLVTGAVELIKSFGRLLGGAIEWVAKLASRATGELGEMFEGIRAFLSKLQTLIAELGEEGALADTGAGGAHVPVPEARPNILESRAVKPPARTSPATTADLTPPKVHPSNVPKNVPKPKGPLVDEAAATATKDASHLATDVEKGASKVEETTHASAENKAAGTEKTVAKTEEPAHAASPTEKAPEKPGPASKRPAGVDEATHEDVESAITESPDKSGRPVRRSRPARPATTGRSEAARTKFNAKRDGYASRLGVGKGGQVHHGIELQTLDKYPGVFTEPELNAFDNMRGIPVEDASKTQLHNSKIREILDRHYRALDEQIAREGLKPGTQEYNKLVRDYLMSGRDEIDHVLGQFFSEYRTGRPRSFH